MRTVRLWQETIRNAATYLASLPYVTEDKIGIVGFSQGSALAVSVAGDMPSVRAVVGYYGATPAWDVYASLYGHDIYYSERSLERLPPVLLHHGTEDTIVPHAEAVRLHATLESMGKAVQLESYQGLGHSFDAPQSGENGKTARESALECTLTFLSRYLR